MIIGNGIRLRLKNNVGEAIILDYLNASTKKQQIICGSSVIGTAWRQGGIIDIPVVCDLTNSGIIQGEKNKIDLMMTYHPIRSGPNYAKDVQGEVYSGSMSSFFLGGLLQNNDFEVDSGVNFGGGDTIAGNNIPDVWGCGNQGGTGSWTLNPDSHSGGKSLMLTAGTSFWVACYQQYIPVYAGRTYKAFGYYKCPAGQSVQMFFGDDITYGLNAAGGSWLCDGTWQVMSVTFTPPNPVRMALYVYGQDSHWRG